MSKFVPAHFSAPESAALGGLFLLQGLGPQHADADFAAVRGSADHIRHVFGPDNGWPDASLSFEENLADLQRHAQEFEERRAFNYALLSAEGNDYLGCLYIKPIKSRLAVDARRERFQAQAFFWLRHPLPASSPDLDADTVLRQLQAWLARDWPFRPGAVVFPGRIQGWAEWAAMASGANVCGAAGD